MSVRNRICAGLVSSRVGLAPLQDTGTANCYQLGQEGVACQLKLIPQIFKPGWARHTTVHQTDAVCAPPPLSPSCLAELWVLRVHVGRGVLLPVRVTGCAADAGLLELTGQLGELTPPHLTTPRGGHK